MRTFLIVDDHQLFADGLRSILEQLDDQVTVVAVTRAADALALITEQGHFDAVLLDLNLPDAHGLQVLNTLNRAFPLLPVIIVSADDNPADMHRALHYGARGYIHKGSTGKIVTHAIRLVLDGGVYIPPQMLRDMPDSQADAAHCALRSDAASDGALRISPSPCALTPRQSEVLRCIIDGLSNKQIGQRLDISEATAKAHVTAVLKSLNAPNRTTAAQIARKLGWVSL